MRAEQLDRLEGEARLRYAESVDGDGPPDARINVSAYVLCDLIADYRRLRELERAVRGMAQKLPGPLWGFVFSDEDTPGDGMVRVEVTPESDTIGRLLEGDK